MKRTLPILLTLLLGLALTVLQPSVFAQTGESISPEDSEQDDAPSVGRVARLSFMQGDVSFLRAGVTEWAPAVENLPLLAGDHIFAGRGGRAEIQLGRGSYIRLSENTELTIAQLSDSAAQFEVTEGTAIVRLERLTSAFGRFEMDTPNSALILIKDGVYRVDVRGEKWSELIVRGGEADVSTDEGSFKVRDGYRLLVDTASGGKLELAVDTTRDDWDQWSYDRDTTIAKAGASIAPDDVTVYETTYNDFYGASDLSSYGTWTNYSSYGRCWIPRVGADWAPYRLGQWIWIPAAGWTWLSSEPWGWAPYHYGRWSYFSGLGWAWIPGFGPQHGYGYRDYHWRPALVSFFNWSSTSGHFVGWQPLAPGERWHRPDRRGRDDGHAHLQYPSPRDGRRRPGDREFVIQPVRPGRGVTMLPVEGFTHGDRTTRPRAPGREQSGWLEKGTRPGLPEINPAPVAIAPVLGDNDRRRERMIAVPPANVIARPVVTRNTDGDKTKLGTSRERRLILPPTRGSETHGPALIDHSERGGDRRSKPSTGSEPNDPSPALRMPVPKSPSKADGGSSKAERRNRESGSNSVEETRPRADKRAGSHDVEVSVPRQEQPRSENREQVRQERRQEKERQEQPRQENREQGRQERRQERERQEQPRPENREQVRPEHRPEQRQEPPRTENRDQTRQERHQEKEQRQQPQEQRKKP